MITFHYGAMRGGKSAHLIRSVSQATKLSIPIAVFSTINAEVSSRNGKRFPAKKTKGVDFQKFHEKNPHIKIIVIDECQFLTEEQVFQLAHLTDIDIFVYGIRTNIAGHPFKASSKLLSYSDYFIGIEPVCENEGCDDTATMNLLYDENGNLMRRWKVTADKIADDRWKSVCPACFWREFKNA